MAEYVLGVDAGGTKTNAVVADRSGTLRGLGRAGSANYQGCGRAGAAAQVRLAVEAACSQAGVALDGLTAACYGMSGADRTKDFEIIRALLAPITPCRRLRLENDTVVALRAGTRDGVGIALIAGTGSNAIGRTAAGIKLQVGGLGRLSGDFGSAPQLAEAAIVAAFKGQDGRGPKTVLARSLPTSLGLERLEDLIEFGFYDREGPPLDPGSLAPLVFEAASAGDPAALGVLVEAGREIAQAVRVILARLFPGDERVTVVFGGSVFQKGTCQALIETVVREVRALRATVRFVLLEAEPVLGAVNFAFDDAGWPIDDFVWRRLRQSFRQQVG